MSKEFKSKALQIVFPAIFASMSVFMTLVNLVVPFPILPYLRFELAEIPIITIFLIMGPIPGLSSTCIYWAILNVVGEWVPIGPAMKLLSLAPTIIGLWMGFELYKRLSRGRRSTIVPLGLSISFGIILRVLVTSLLNFIILWYLFPFFLDVAAGSLISTLGINLTSQVSTLLITLFFTAIFNIIHTFLSFIPSYMVVKAVANAKLAGLRNMWFDWNVISK